MNVDDTNRATEQRRLNQAAAKAVKKLRSELKLTQAEFAKQINQSAEFVQHLEAGDRDVELVELFKMGLATGKGVTIKFVEPKVEK